MIDVEPLIEESFARLYPVPVVAADWDGVLGRAGAGRRQRLRLDWFLPVVPRRLRLAFVLIALLLLLAGIATATYVGVRGWISASPRGVQYKSDYRLATVFSSTGNPVGWSEGGNPVPWWTSLALGPAGRDLFAMTLPVGARTPVLVRIAGVDRGTRLRANTVLDLRRLHVPNWCAWPFVRPLTGAANGDIFFVAGGADRPPIGTGCAIPGATNDTQLVNHSPAESARRGGLGHLLLFVLHRDGLRQLILSGNDLVRSKLFPPDWMEWEIAASAPDRVWLWAVPLDAKGPQRLFELIDPNADGNWSDRIVRHIELPGTLASRRSWQSVQLAAEPSLPKEGSSRSVLAAAADGRSFRVYRIADWNDDGDALDPGEVSVLFERRGAGGGAQIAARVVVRGGVARRELVVAGLSRPDRVSLVSRFGGVRDVARAFRGLSTVLAGSTGELYPITGSWDFNQATNSLVVYRLAPTPAGKGTISVGSPVARAVPAVTFPTPLPGGTPRLAFAVSDVVGNISNSWTIGANGRGLRRLVSHVHSICQSADGRGLAYSSDAEVPTEFFTYVARDGGRPVKITERDDRVVCPASMRSLLLYRPDRPVLDRVGTLIRHDVRTSRETVVAQGVDRYALSPDATKLVYVRHQGSRDALTVVDLATLQRRTIAGPEAATLYSFVAYDPGETTDLNSSFGALAQADMRWSPDATRIAYYTELRSRGATQVPMLRRALRTLWVRDVATGRPLLRLAIRGLPPLISWSPDGARLLVNVVDRLLLVDVRRGSARTVTRDVLRQDLFPGWAPVGNAFAYGTLSGLFVVGSDDRTRQLASTTRLVREDPRLNQWGWSPDGRYIGTSGGCTDKASESIQLVNVRTGRLRTLRPFAGAHYVCPTWWR
jgi:hypothetical protein